MRKCFISPKKHFILSDTVGFIKNLPTELVVSFKTTLDEINYSDYLLHVIDVSNPEWENQKETVEKILQTILGVNFNQKKIIEVWNKFDLLNNDDLSFFNNYSRKKENTILFSSKLKLGKEKLLELIKKKIRKNKKFLLFNLPRPIDSKKIKPLL